MKLTTTLILFLLILNSFYRGFAICSLPTPTSLKLKNQTNCSVDVSWKIVTGSSYYRVEYKQTGSDLWIFSGNISGTSVSISGLASNTSYDFAVASFCSDSTTIGYSSFLSKKTDKCSLPIDLIVSSVTTNSAVISWTPLCGSSVFTLQYREQGITLWTKVSHIPAISYTLTNLQHSTEYEYRMQTNCGSINSTWSSVFIFTTASDSTQNNSSSNKNVLLIVLDDARYDAFIPNGAPSWFNTPAINSIAEEGANFKLAFPTTAQCAPSRACIYTGVYPHVNHVMSNGDTLDNSFPLIQQILKDHGYYTGFVGKYGQFLNSPTGFNWWATSEGNVYVDPLYHINGKDTAISGHISDVYPQLAKTFLNSVPAGQNFVLFYFTRAPHGPTVPRQQDSLLYLNDTMPFPSNFSFYSNNFPSFYTDHEWHTNEGVVNDLKLRTYQSLKGVEDNVDSLMTWLSQRGVIDSTLIMFTSDNGFLMGEHRMQEKILALEESARVPMFVRYPEWFGAGTVINDQIASNVDIATTLLDFAAIPNTYNFQGLSLRQLATGQTPRKNFLYESGFDPTTAKLRAVRTINDIYIRSYCKTTCEEYYDLITDPLENTNQIFNPDYAATISSRRILLDSLRNVYHDITPSKKTCRLITDAQRLESYEHETPESEMIISPNPALHSFTIYFTSYEESPVAIMVYDELGHQMWSRSYEYPPGAPEEINCLSWSNGFYLVKVEQEGKVLARKVLIQE